jgi:hypothetical protein
MLVAVDLGKHMHKATSVEMVLMKDLGIVPAELQ